MSETTSGEVTRLLLEWSSGREEALDQLMPLLHNELTSIASALLRRERRDHTLETSALVNEAYVELRQFGGLTYEEIGLALGTSRTTVARGWRMAGAWLYRHLALEEPA